MARTPAASSAIRKLQPDNTPGRDDYGPRFCPKCGKVILRQRPAEHLCAALFHLEDRESAFCPICRGSTVPVSNKAFQALASPIIESRTNGVNLGFRPLRSCARCGVNESQTMTNPYFSWCTAKLPSGVEVFACGRCAEDVNNRLKSASQPIQPSRQVIEMLQYAEQELLEASELDPANEQTKKKLTDVRQSMQQLGICSNEAAYVRAVTKRTIPAMPDSVRIPATESASAQEPVLPSEARRKVTEGGATKTNRPWWAFWKRA